MDASAWDRLIRLQRPLVVEGIRVETLQEVVEFYTQQMSRFGPSGRALAYPEEELYAAKLEQYRRILSRLIQPTDSVLDVGCGYGSLLSVIGECDYTGVDLVSSFLDEARWRHPGHRFITTDVMRLSGQYDWVVGLGITGTVPEPAHLVAKMWELAAQGMVTDFIDQTRYSEDLNCFDIRQCLNMLHQWGATEIKLHSWAAYIWATFEVHR